VQNLLQELELHQVEFQAQNEELRRACDELLEKTEWFESAPIGCVTLNKEGKILEANAVAAELFGLKNPKSLFREPLSKFVMEEFLSAWHKHRRAAFAGDGKQFCEIGMYGAGRRPLWVRLEGALFGPSNDRRCRVALLDVTDRKNAEDARNELTKTLGQRISKQTAQIHLQAEAIEHLAEGVMILEGKDWLQSRILFANAAMCRITRYTSAELIGRSRQSLFGVRTQRKTLERINHELSAGRTCSAELVQSRKDGEPYLAHLSITPLKRGAGRAATFVSIHRDITLQKKGERDLAQYRDELKKLASELISAEERERRRLAEDLHDSVGQALFLARTKIAALSPAPDAKEAGAIVEDIGRMMNTLAFELSPPVLRTLGLRPALKSLAIDMRQRYSLPVDIDDDGSDFTLSERAAMTLFRCTRELLINVAKHAKTDRAGLSMSKLKREIRVIVSDKGKGFDLNHSHLVGSGHFGLFSVRERLSAIGGTFKVRSAPGKGTSITITAPFGAAAR
jgi:PAS domain S-box-containing protein